MSANEDSSSSPSPSSIKDSAVIELLSHASSQSQKYHSSPASWEDQQLYFLLPDRFSNGDEDGALSNDNKTNTGTIKAFASTDNANAISPPNDPGIWRENGTVWQKGTLRGVISKIGYLKRLGITAIWIGPIFKQRPHDDHLYHGYAVQDFLSIDPHFGTREELRDLVKKAHEEGIYVILDIILNHSGDVFEYEKGKDEQGDKTWSGHRYPVAGFRDSKGDPTLPFQPIDPSSPPTDPRDCAIWPIELQTPETFTREGAIRSWDNWPEYLRGDFLSLKDIDLGPDAPDNFTPTPALTALCQVYKYWIAYADLDGYRIDTVKHMGDGPTRYLCTQIHEYATLIGKQNYFLVGEVTGSRAFDVVEQTGLNAALGIGNVQEKLWSLPKGLADPQQYFDLFRNATYLKKGTNAWMKDKVVTMIDDHDQVWRGEDKARFCSDVEGSKLVVAALGLNLTTLGIPCIYYGTEQGFDGKGNSDRYIRETMFGGSFGAFRSKDRHFFNEKNPIFEEIAKISALREREIALRRGRQYLREISGDGVGFGYPRGFGGRMKSLVAWSRIFAEQEVLCVLNTDSEKSTEAWVTVDTSLHEVGARLKRIYPTPKGEEGEVKVQARNGKAVLIKVEPAGFAVYN